MDAASPTPLSRSVAEREREKEGVIKELSLSLMLRHRSGEDILQFRLPVLPSTVRAAGRGSPSHLPPPLPLISHQTLSSLHQVCMILYPHHFSPIPLFLQMLAWLATRLPATCTATHSSYCNINLWVDIFHLLMRH